MRNGLRNTQVWITMVFLYCSAKWKLCSVKKAANSACNSFAQVFLWDISHSWYAMEVLYHCFPFRYTVLNTCTPGLRLNKVMIFADSSRTFWSEIACVLIWACGIGQCSEHYQCSSVPLLRWHQSYRPSFWYHCEYKHNEKGEKCQSATMIIILTFQIFWKGLENSRGSTTTLRIPALQGKIC